MPANFPDSPTLNQTYTYGAMTWQWTGSYWSVVESANYTAVTAITANLVPSVNEVYNLGSATLRWRDLYLSGNSLVLGAATISASGSAITLPANSSIGTTSFGSTSLTTQDLTVTGNLTVNGTTTTINSTTLSIDDKNIVLADGAANAAAADGAGITVAGASATLTYASASDSWNVNKNILITPGTANGVLYLNASKVATTGSALTFDGAQLGVNGITVGRGAGAVSTNTAMGASALAANTTGSRNTAFGYVAGATESTTIQNSYFGAYAGYQNTGSANTLIGDQAGWASGSGSDLVAVGAETLKGNTTGGQNTAIGRLALYSNTTGYNNTAVGYQAGYTNQAGANLVALGYQAGYSSNADNNTFIGYYAGQGTTGTRNTFVGVNGVGYLVTSGTKNTIIGAYSGNQGGLDIRTASNYIVLSDGDGNPRMQFDSSGFSFQQGTAFYNKKLVVEGSPNLGAYKGYLILAKAYVSGLQNKSVVQGTFTLIRGSTGSGERNDVYYVDSSSGYNGDTFSVKVQSGRDSFFVQTVKVTYGGVVYHAIETSVSGGEPDNGVWFNGFYYNCSPIYTDATYCSSITAYGYADASNLNETQALYLQNGRLQFPATQNASSNANTLDDYEEGTWSPVITDATYNATMAAGTFGRYTKIGRLVTCQIYVETTSLGSLGPGQIYISGWPFPIDKSGGGCFSFGGGLNITANQSVTLRPWSSGLMLLSKWNAATGTSSMISSDWSADGSGFITVSYEV